MAEPVKPLTLEEVSELRLKAQQQAGNIAMSGTDWANIALLIVAEQIARLADHSLHRVLGEFPTI